MISDSDLIGCRLSNVPTPAAAAAPFAGLVTTVGPPKNTPTPSAAAAPFVDFATTAGPPKNLTTPSAAAEPFAGLVTAVGPPNNVPTPSATAAPSNKTFIAVKKAPVLPSVEQITVSSCGKARIRVEDQKGTVQGWI